MEQLSLLAPTEGNNAGFSGRGVRVLSLTQPWASLVALGHKRIETRSWSTKYRGKIAIHAAKGFPRPARELCYDDPFYVPLLEEYDEVANLLEDALPLGAIIATADLVGCVGISSIRTEYDEPGPTDGRGNGTFSVPPDEPELSFGDYTPGRFAWLLENVQELPTPIPAKGSLGLWTFQWPENI